YDDPSEMDSSTATLVQQATQALEHSYSPYSRFQVAAALRLANGEIVSGSNQENASYPLCLCAERVALFAAAARFPGVAVQAIFVTSRHDDSTEEQAVTPCGACRQVMVETEMRQGSPLQVYLRGQEDRIFAFKKATDLLPLKFDGTHLR
ncbi:MAG: cytidine deaminase, partial [Bacteroidota bacterium]